MIKTEEVLGKMLSELNNEKNICFYASTNDLDKYFYDIPYDNGDIIQAQFIKIINEDDVLKRNKMIKNLKKLFPKQLVVIKKLLDIMDKMNKEQFLNFIDDIYIRNEFQLNYAKISQGGGNKKKFKIRYF